MWIPLPMLFDLFEQVGEIGVGRNMVNAEHSVEEKAEFAAGLVGDHMSHFVRHEINVEGGVYRRGQSGFAARLPPAATR